MARRSSSPNRFCSRACANGQVWPGAADRNAAKCRARRALKAGRISESYTTAEIAERDNFRCGLCGEPVDMAESGLEPMGPSIDHVQPISLGGNDLKSNVQLAHRRCNTVKGNRISFKAL